MKFCRMMTLYRKDQKISIRKLARLTGVDFRTIYQIESHHRSPTARNLVKLMAWAFSE